MRRLLFKLIYHSGLINHFLRKNRSGKNVPILCFHSVSNIRNRFIQPITTNEFERIINKLREYYRFYTLDAVFNGDDLDPQAIVITFDDALLDFYQNAYPILKSYNIPVTVFVPTSSVERKEELYNYRLARLLELEYDPFELNIEGTNFKFKSAKMTITDYLKIIRLLASIPNRRGAYLKSIEDHIQPSSISSPILPMDWKQINEIIEDGNGIGSHFESHSRLPDLSDESVMFEFEQSKRILEEELSFNLKYFAYPMGASDDRIRSIVRRYSMIGFGTGDRHYTLNTPDNNIPRFNISDNYFEEVIFRINGFHKFINHKDE